jgi:hypothetical protein
MGISKTVLFAATFGILLTAAHPGLSQTSSQAFGANPRAHYQAMKQILGLLVEQEDQKWKREEERHLAQLRRSDPEAWRRRQAERRESERRVDLYTCRDGGDFLSHERLDDNNLLLPMTQLAVDTIDLSRVLRRFPRQLWEAAVGDFEAQELAAIISRGPDSQGFADRRTAMLNRLAARLNAARRTNPDLPEAAVEGGCGAGEITVTIETDPPGGQVLFIPTFFYELCKAQRLNPDDTERCNYWREAISGTLSNVSGDYFFVARWSDGSARRGKLGINPKQEGQTIRLGKR